MNNRLNISFSAIVLLSALFLIKCSNSPQDSNVDNLLHIPFEKYELENGLDVILHQDTSNPIVAVSIQYHAGSINEKPGKTGLAHYVEHMLFQGSENLHKGEFINKLNELGGRYNGGTGNDYTSYFEVFPKDALEKVLWMESDRMGL